MESTWEELERILENFSIKDGVLYYTGRTPRTLEEAYQISIAKWQLVVTHAPILDGGGGTCGFCKYFAYHENGPPYCPECPISKAGYDECLGSPYYSYRRTPTKKNAIAELEFIKRAWHQRRID